MKERAGKKEGRKEGRERERKRERQTDRQTDMGAQALMEQGYFIIRNVVLHIFSEMITQLLHRMKFYQ